MALKVSCMTTGEVKGGIYTGWTLTSSLLGSQNDPVNPSTVLILVELQIRVTNLLSTRRCVVVD